MLTMRQLKSIIRFELGLIRHLFIHIPKNGGMAIRNSRDMRRRTIFADPYFHVSREYTRRLHETMAADGEHHGDQHARLRDISPDVLKRVQPFSIVRNPWKRVYSRFTFQYKYLERQGQEVDYSRRNFEAFLDSRHEYMGREFYWHRAIKGWYPQCDYLKDRSGKFACDVLRQEFLAEEISKYFGPVELPTRNRSGLRAPHYSTLYTPQTIQLVADLYAEDIDRFGFDFDTPATRNTVFTQ